MATAAKTARWQRTSPRASRGRIAAMLSQPWNCSALVMRPLDAAPVRSPQAVHSVLAAELAGLHVVEIGTRNGDGISCFSQAAKSAVAIEMEPDYCTSLRKRSERQRRWRRSGFSVSCEYYEKCTPDADVYTWWQVRHTSPRAVDADARRCACHLRLTPRPLRGAG